MVTKKTATTYTGEIKVLGKKYTAKGKTPQEVIENFKIGQGARGMSVLKISKGDKSVERVLNGSQTTRLFGPASSTMKEIVFKQVATLFDI